MEKITGTISNVPVDNIDISNLLPKTSDSTRLVIKKLKRKLEYGGHFLSSIFCLRQLGQHFCATFCITLKKIIICIKIL